MSRFDENLFRRIAVYNNYISKAQLEECLREQQDCGGKRPLSEILQEKGYLAEEQLASILDVRRKKLRKYLRSPKEAQESDRTFGQIALNEGLVDLEQLEDALLEQERLARLNLRFRVGEILVAKKILSAEDVLAVLSKQGKRILVCPACESHFNVAEFEESASYRCAKCEERLEVPKYLDSVAVDAVL